MLKVIVLLSCVLCAFAIQETETLRSFSQFAAKYNKKYTSGNEFRTRYEIFKNNLQVIDDLNARSKSAKFAVNQFADMTAEEFKKTMFPQSMEKPDWPTLPERKPEELQDLPETWDWRDHGVVTPVKDQGQCGSCWSFSTTGNVEGQWALAGHSLVALSEQNLVDCDHNCMTFDGSQACDSGCQGGLMPNAFRYVMSNGLMSENDYPYTAADGNCHFDSNKVVAKVSNWTMVPGQEDQMASYLTTLGPLSIAVDATLWQFYWSGVFDFKWCGSTLDHGVLIVGFGHQTDMIGEDVNYWLIKNSWGASWGENGYIKLYRGGDQCGVNLFVCSSLIGDRL